LSSPGDNSDVIALTVAQRFAKALGRDFIIQIPSQRVAPHSDRILDYDGYPENLGEYLANQTSSSPPLSVYTVTNIAHDLIASVNHEKEKDSRPEQVVYGVSFGTAWLNRALQIDPELFSFAFMDGVVVRGNSPSIINKLLTFIAGYWWIWHLYLQKLGVEPCVSCIRTLRRVLPLS
jgi:hypothetical protein